MTNGTVKISHQYKKVKEAVESTIFFIERILVWNVIRQEVMKNNIDDLNNFIMFFIKLIVLIYTLPGEIMFSKLKLKKK